MSAELIQITSHRNRLKNVLIFLLLFENAIIAGALFCFAFWWVFIRQPVDPSWTEQNVAASMSRGYDVAEALERFHQKFGRYPAKLAELVPNELSSIPPPLAGKGIWEYDYYPEPPNSYGLGFSSTFAPPGWDYSPADRKWSYYARKSDD